MLELILFWLSTYIQVALLGLQSRNVNTGRYVWAALTSLAIGATQLVAVRGMVSNAPWVVLLLTGTAGPLGIVSAMLFFRHAIERGTKK
jgi:hypothetical protein